jgi:hypothetical protein
VLSSRFATQMKRQHTGAEVIDIKTPTLVTSQTRDFAERLIAIEAALGMPSKKGIPAAFRACEKLRRPLTALAGAAGYHSLLLRALTLASREAPGLDGVRIKADGSLEDEPDQNSHDADGGTLLVAGLIGLLFSFVGETLTLRLVHDVWPGALFMSLGSNGSVSLLPARAAEEHEPQGQGDDKPPGGVAGPNSILRQAL